MTTIILRPAAAADIEQAFRWYEQRRPGLGDEFLELLDSALGEIRAHPERFPVIHRDTRRMLLSRFPYAIFYRIYESGVVVVACMHAHRDPTHWRIRQ